MHKVANTLDKLPKRLQSRAKGLLLEIMEAPKRRNAEEGLTLFTEEFQIKYRRRRSV